MDISKILTDLIWQNKQTAADLSRATKIPRATIHHILSGKTKHPRQNVLEKLSLYFGITIDQLTGDAPIPSLSEQSDKVLLSGSKSIPLIAWSSGKRSEIKVEEGAKYHLAVLIDSDRFEPIFPEGSTVFVANEEAPKDRGYALVVQGDSMHLVRTLIDLDEVYIKVIGQGEPGQLINLKQFKHDFIYVIKEIRTPL